MSPLDKPLIWLHHEIKSPPFSSEARIEAGFFLRKLQKGEQVSLPHSRPMPSIGKRCHELRINDKDETWRLVYRIDKNHIILLEIFKKKTQSTPQKVVNLCKSRIKLYESIILNK